MDKQINDLFFQLSKSSFRSKFHLSKKELDYINQKGLEIIKEHAREFIKKRLAQDKILNDGKQTPMRGHPVFIAQHATATCCRSCLYKWHHIPSNKLLNDDEQEYIVKVIMEWIQREFDISKNTDKSLL